MTKFNEMPPDSRVWVYQSDREFSAQEIDKIAQLGDAFIDQWSSHGTMMRAAMVVLNRRFIVLSVDEKQAMASGCSIDKSVHFIKQLEKDLGLNLLGRMNVAYKSNGEILTFHFSELTELLDKGRVSLNTIVFNNLVATKAEFDKNWELPISSSWLKSQALQR